MTPGKHNGTAQARAFMGSMHAAMGGEGERAPPKRKKRKQPASAPQPRERGAFMNMGRTPAPRYKGSY